MIKVYDNLIDFGGEVWDREKIKTLPENKEHAFVKYINMICNSWTWGRLTEKEKEACYKALFDSKTIGTFYQRWEQYNWLYNAFLRGCGYDSPFWREE